MNTVKPFEIVHEDKYIVAVNKSSGVPVTPDRYDRAKKNLFELVSAVVRKRLWVIHRIDSATSGLVVFAKDPRTHSKLSVLFENRRVEKTYLAAVHGRPMWQEQICDLALVPDGNKKHQTIVDRYNGKKSKTNFKLLCTAGNYALLEAKPETGRTHQIRVHAAALGHPIICDNFYGSGAPVYLSQFKKKWRGDKIDERPLIDRLALHAETLFLPDYGCGEQTLSASLPRDFTALKNQMEKNALQTPVVPCE
ncbi:RNA pseudouridine synthase [Spirochaetia bacterium]|nr:RNA pseudouridine synthase [Spirochaetia bacterium]